MRTSTLPMLLLTLGLAACAGDRAIGPDPRADASADRSSAFPDVITLPDGFGADGLAFGAGAALYVGSYSSGAIWRADARTGNGSLLVAPQPGRAACALAYDARARRLFAAGSFTGGAWVYDAASGATLGAYQLGDPAAGPTGILDVVVLRDAAYFTDALRPVLYRVPVGSAGALGSQSAVQVLPYKGDYRFLPGGVLNSTGLVATPDERWLIVVNTTTGRLYRVDPTTAQTTEIDLAGADLASSDGLALVGHTLYADEVLLNRVAVVRLDADFTHGVVEPTALRSELLDSPSKIAVLGSAVYAANARFETFPAPGVPYEVVRLAR